MIIHRHRLDLPDDGGPVIFSELMGFTCSICAPLATTKEEIEAFATAKLGTPVGEWECVDKSQIGFGGGPTPNPCNLDVGRRHWFLLAGTLGMYQMRPPPEPTECDTRECIALTKHTCPDCGNREFALGPAGGMSRNIECTKCKSRFNVTTYRDALIHAHRIENSGEWPDRGMW